MYAQQQQPRKAPGAAQTTSTFQTQNEAAAREKLAAYVYEYLVHSGAKQTADAFKAEMLQNQNNVKVNPNEAPGFLLNWWFVFWDLYCAAPERRDTCDSSQEAKAFHEFGFIPSNFTPHPGQMMNGMHGGPPQFAPNAAPSPLGMPTSHEGMMPGHPGGSFPGGPPRYAHPGAPGGPRNPNPAQMGPGYGGPGGPPHMFPGGDQMRGIPPQRMPNAQPPPGANPALRMPAAFIRPNAPLRYAAPGGQMYMDSPNSTGFPPGQMMSNGAMMSSPGPSGPMQGPPDGSDPRYMMMSAPSSLPYGMGSEGSSVVSQAGSMNVPGVSSAGGPPHDGPASKISGLINGEADMKQSPASNLNGGTPAGGGPGSQCGPASVHNHGPGSVHSQGGGGPVSGAGGPPQQQPQEEQSEISKIKASIMEDVMHFGGKEDHGYGVYGGMS
ncbi:hypothetical protein QR680_000881 [Steinernema hermaphroditum]|uniref:LisH domain-containing protein n=1 Tax=Steinernema hermaphroditum TaxID=289476 RepID=A0AA39LEV8_9BILA|nr:hypothetical protein QR680_000881 [Steinernema hermaphroditum]